MPQTLSEKILSAKVGKAVKAGDIVIADVDLVFVVDSSGPLSFREMADMGLERVAHPERTVLFMDHNVPSPRAELSQEQDFLRQMAAKHELRLYDVGDGICHQLVLEELGVPGGVTIGADSHTCTAGALCNFGTGMGASDVAVVMGTGKTWLRVPESIEVRLQGRLPVGVFAKDIALELERIVTAGGGTYMALEFTGPTVAMLSVSERATLANMAVEMGGKIGFFPSDEQARRWLAEHGREEAWRPIETEEGASYARVVAIDCATLEPMVACPHTPDNVKSVSMLKGTPIHEVYIGTCTNARLDDLAVAAGILKGRHVHPGTRLIVIPSSRKVLQDGMRLGYIQDLVAAGASLGPPSCGTCFGMHMGVPADGENVMSTQNRNFKARMGNANAFVYLGSPAVAAMAALTREISDPRDVLADPRLAGQG